MLINIEEMDHLDLKERVISEEAVQYHDRNNRKQRIAYCVECANFRIRKCMRSNSAGERSFSNGKIRNNLPVCSAERRSVDANQIMASHTKGGIQKRNFCGKDTTRIRLKTVLKRRRTSSFGVN